MNQITPHTIYVHIKYPQQQNSQERKTILPSKEIDLHLQVKRMLSEERVVKRDGERKEENKKRDHEGETWRKDRGGFIEI